MTRLDLVRTAFAVLALLGVVLVFGVATGRVVWGQISPIHFMSDLDQRDAVFLPISNIGGLAFLLGSLGVLFIRRRRD